MKTSQYKWPESYKINQIEHEQYFCMTLNVNDSGLCKDEMFESTSYCINENYQEFI